MCETPLAPMSPLLVACLCAAWCRTCDDYRPVFEALRAQHAAQADFVWVDIEDDAAVLGDIDVEDFPTLLIARGEQGLFFGPVLPHARTAQDLLQRALADRLAPIAAGLAAPLAGLIQRLRRARA